MKLKLAVLVLLVLVNVLPALLRQAYSQQGLGDQSLTFGLVFGAFITPALWPLLQFKTLVFNVLLPDWVEGHLALKFGALLLTPSHNFSAELSPKQPDYSLEAYWSLLPNRTSGWRDASGNTFGGREPHPTKECSAFYLHPSTWYTSQGWNGEPLNPITSYLADDAIGPQHAGAFNLKCRLFAPRFRQMAAAGFLQPDGGLANANSRQALDLAYSDVKRAFQYFLQHHHRGEAIFVVGHSQGSVLGERLVREFFNDDAKLFPYLAAAYLPGWTFFHHDFAHGLVRVCQTAQQTGCVVSWRTFARGGNYRAFLHVDAPSEQHSAKICTNPLSWRSDDLEHRPHTDNLGGLHVMHYLTMWKYLVGGNTYPADRVCPPALVSEISDAQCDGEGNLLITPPTHYGYGWGLWPFPAFTFAAFPGSNLHTYDVNFFFANVQQNVLDRLEAWKAEVRS